jgi:hypothetical protein
MKVTKHQITFKKIKRQRDTMNDKYSTQLLDDYSKFYECLNKLENGIGGKRQFRDCNGYLYWPKKGVYFIFEKNEKIANMDDLRVVYVGTHPGKTSMLWRRLYQHRGTENGLGHSYSSILREHVGDALHIKDGSFFIDKVNRRKRDKATLEKEKLLESKISKYIGAMSILYLSVPDKPLSSVNRCDIERKSIALLSKVAHEYNIDKPSSKWIGNKLEGHEHGLWNVRHVIKKDEPEYKYDSKFLKIFESYVDTTIEEYKKSIKNFASKSKIL